MTSRHATPLCKSGLFVRARTGSSESYPSDSFLQTTAASCAAQVGDSIIQIPENVQLSIASSASRVPFVENTAAIAAAAALFAGHAANAAATTASAAGSGAPASDSDDHFNAADSDSAHTTASPTPAAPSLLAFDGLQQQPGYNHARAVHDPDGGAGFGLLSLVLLSEVARGSKSHFAPYVLMCRCVLAARPTPSTPLRPARTCLQANEHH